MGAEDGPDPGLGGLVTPTSPTPPVPTDVSVYGDVAPALGEAFGRAGAGDRVLYGFVDHELTTTYLGSTTGLRLRHVQPTGHWACTGKTADLRRSAWVGGATRDFAGVDPLAMEASWPPGSAGPSGRSRSRRGATTRCCRRARSPT